MMFRTAIAGLGLSRVSHRIPLANQPPYASPRIASCSRIRPSVTQIPHAAFGTGWVGSLLSERVLGALEVIHDSRDQQVIAVNKAQINPGDHHLIAIYYYDRSSVYELDVPVPKEKDINAYADDKLHVKYEGGCFADFLKEKLQNVSEKKEKKLCLKIAELCGGGRIRGINRIGQEYDCGTFMAEVEVGTRKDWAKNHRRPYDEGRSILKEDLGDGVMVRLCEGEQIW